MNRLASQAFFSADRHLRLVTLSLMNGGGGILLDCGCGNCEFTEAIVRRIHPSLVLALDENEDWRRQAFGHGWVAVPADLNYPLQLKGGMADILHAGQIIEHLNDTDTFCKEVKRMLKPTGYAVISTPNLASWHNIFSLCLGRQPRAAMVSDEIPISDSPQDLNMPKHRRLFTAAGLRELLEFHGLKVLAMRGAGFYPFPNALARLSPVYLVAKVSR